MANDQSYSNPRWAATHELALGRITPTVSGAAAEVVAQHAFFVNVKVLEVRASMMVAGKGDTSGFDVFKDTASIGQVLFGTGAAASTVDASLTDTEFDADAVLSLKNIVATDTGSAFIDIVYQERYA